MSAKYWKLRMNTGRNCDSGPPCALTMNGTLSPFFAPGGMYRNPEISSPSKLGKRTNSGFTKILESIPAETANVNCVNFCVLMSQRQQSAGLLAELKEMTTASLPAKLPPSMTPSSSGAGSSALARMSQMCNRPNPSSLTIHAIRDISSEKVIPSASHFVFWSINEMRLLFRSSRARRPIPSLFRFVMM